MAKYTTEIAAHQFNGLRSAISRHSTGTVEVWGDANSSTLTVALDESAIRGLSALEGIADWLCVDGSLYAEGSEFPLTVIHNA
jgi:hypothetical protein